MVPTSRFVLRSKEITGDVFARRFGEFVPEKTVLLRGGSRVVLLRWRGHVIDVAFWNGRSASEIAESWHDFEKRRFLVACSLGNRTKRERGKSLDEFVLYRGP